MSEVWCASIRNMWKNKKLRQQKIEHKEVSHKDYKVTDSIMFKQKRTQNNSLKTSDKQIEPCHR